MSAAKDQALEHAADAAQLAEKLEDELQEMASDVNAYGAQLSNDARHADSDAMEFATAAVEDLRALNRTVRRELERLHTEVGET